MISHTLRMNKLRARPGLRAGFTLIELMLVVSLIGIMSAIAVPSVVRLMQDRRSQRDALTLLVTLQDAHTRAFGRGGAVVMTISKPSAPAPAVVGIAESSFDINGGAAGGLIPNPACNGVLPAADTAWWQAAPSDTEFNLTLGGNIGTGDLADGDDVFLCFTPRGDTMGRADPGDQWLKLNAVLTFKLRASGTTGILRQIDVLPNGVSRMRL